MTFIRVNRLSQTRLGLGLDPVFSAGGEVECRVGGLFGCVPVSFFGTDAMTPAMIDFLKVTATRQDMFARKLAGATLTGDLFDLPAGPLAGAFGVEWREEEFSSVPNDVLRSGEVGSAPFPIVTGGDYDVFEVFGEVRVPLLQGVTGIQSLALEGAVRYSDYSTIGGVTTWTGALDWQVNDWARIRGGVSRAIRAPNLNELFAQTSLGFDTGAFDPCWAISNPTPAEQDLCVLQGVPPGLADSLQLLEPGFPSKSGGNPNLNEEEADTYTLGVVFTPIEDLFVALDYFDIENH